MKVWPHEVNAVPLSQRKFDLVWTDIKDREGVYEIEQFPGCRVIILVNEDPRRPKIVQRFEYADSDQPTIYACADEEVQRMLNFRESGERMFISFRRDRESSRAGARNGD